MNIKKILIVILKVILFVLCLMSFPLLLGFFMTDILRDSFVSRIFYYILCFVWGIICETTRERKFKF